jgi:tetratricopeptide (TPR) repeat protein
MKSGFKWDIFISHASEDKTGFVRPLADVLSRQGLNVWLDDTSISPGDDIRQRIDEGLTRSRCAVVVLSPAFFEKPWAQKELGGLVMLGVAGRTRLLPILYQMDPSELLTRSPMLAGHAVIRSDSGVEAIAAEIIRALQGSPSGTDESKRPRKRRQKLLRVTALTMLLMLSALSALSVSPRLCVRFLQVASGPTAAIHWLSQFVQDHPADYDSICLLASLQEKERDREGRIATLEGLLRNEAALAQIPAERRPSEVTNIHFELGLEYLSYDGSEEGVGEDIKRAKQALVHLENARLVHSLDPMILWVLATASMAVDNSPANKLHVEELLTEARRLTEAQKVSGATESSDQRLNFMYDFNQHYWSARALEGFGGYEAATREYDAALAAAEDAGCAVCRIQALRGLGMSELERTGDFEKALSHWDELDPVAKSELAIKAAVTERKRGDELKRLGKAQDAERAFSLAEGLLMISLNRDQFKRNVYFELGLVANSREKYVESAGHFRAVIELAPKLAVAHHLLGRALYLAKDYKEAERAMARACELNPRDANAHLTRGLIALAQDQYMQARLAFEEALKLELETQERYAASFNLAWLFAYYPSSLLLPGETMMTLRERALQFVADVPAQELSEKQQQKLRELRSVLWNALAYNYAEAEINLELAFDYVNRALKEKPLDTDSLDTQGWILVKRAEKRGATRGDADFRKARSLFEQSLKLLEPGDKESQMIINYHLGYLEQLAGRRQQARQLFLRALEYDPTYAPAKHQLESSMKP